jgi:putative heme-binding domain-containing protein
MLVAAAAAEKPDTTRRPWTTSKIAGTPEPPEPYKLASPFPKLKFERPTSIEQVPGANRLLVTEMGGKILTFEKQPTAATPDLLVDLKTLLPKELADKGVSLFDAEFHPRYKDNHYLFICYVHPGNGGHTRVSRLTLTNDAVPKMVEGSEEFIIGWPSGGHNAGCLEFGKDEMLYIATGDGSGPNPPDGLTTGQNVSDLLGALLRIDVDHVTGNPKDPMPMRIPLNYAIPKDNPFVDTRGARPEIWAYGLRNPWKFGTDPKSGDIFVADNGWESWEMVHRIVRGGNCGWPVMEGRVALRSEVKVGPTAIIPPVKDHPHTEANSVIGGPVYRGKKLPELDGWFIYGDYITGTIWGVKREKDDTYSFQTLCDTDQRIVAFTEGSGGELYVLDYDFTGQIYEVAPSGLKDLSATFPRRLSETGLFEALHIVTPAIGVVPYEVQVDRWMDGATAERWIAIPDKGQVKLSLYKDEPSEFPEGTVLVKHLSLPQGQDLPPIRLETQLLHFENGVWHPYSYLWDDFGRDATLVESTGKNRTLKVAAKDAKDGFIERTWHVNAVNECKLCHNAESRYVLGFTPNQLTRAVQGSIGANVLTYLSSIKAITDEPHVAADHPLRLVDPHDEKQKLDDRARSYLHANCSMCHQPGGNAIVSFFLRRDLPFDKLNTNKGTGIGTFGMRDAKIIVPGDPYRSVLMYRFSKLGYARMPYIGSQVVDSRGAALIEDWIRSLPGGGDGKSSGPITKDSPDEKALEVLNRSAQDGNAEAINQLLSSSEGALALALQIHRRVLMPEDRQTAIEAGGKAAKSDIRGLFETFIPEAKRRPTLGPRVDPQVVLSKMGDGARGKLIFFSDGARCRNCHEADDKANSLGPTVRETNKKYPKTADLLQHVLQPSLKVEEPFAAYNVLTTDGRALQGLLIKKSDKEVVIKTLEKKTVRLPSEKIEELKKSDKSLMPEGILSDLTAQEAADLLEYWKSLGTS